MLAASFGQRPEESNASFGGEQGSVPLDPDETNTPLACELRQQIGQLREQVLRVFPAQTPSEPVMPSPAESPTRRTTATQPQQQHAIPLLVSLRERGARYQSTVGVESAIAKDVANSTREERVALLLGVPAAHLKPPRATEQREDARAQRAAAADATLNKDPRAVAALASIDASGVDNAAHFRLALATVFAMLLDDVSADALDLAFELASQDWVDELSRVRNVEERFADATSRASFVASTLRKLLRDIAAVGCGTRLYGTLPSSSSSSGGDRSREGATSSTNAGHRQPKQQLQHQREAVDGVFADDLVRTLLVVLCMWQVATGRMRRLKLIQRSIDEGIWHPAPDTRNAGASSPAGAASPVHGASPADAELGLPAGSATTKGAAAGSIVFDAALDAQGGRRVYIGRKPRTTTERLEAALVLKSRYEVAVDPTKRGVQIPDMLPPNVRQTGLCVGRKVARLAAEAKVTALRSIAHDERLRDAHATRERDAKEIEGIRRVGGSVSAAVQARSGVAARPPDAVPSTTWAKPAGDSLDHDRALSPSLATMARIDDIIKARGATPGLDGPGPAPAPRTTTVPMSPPRTRPAVSSTPPPPIYVSQQRHRNATVRDRAVFTLDTSSVLKSAAVPRDGATATAATPTVIEDPPTDAHQGAAARAFKCKSRAMADFNRFVYDRDRSQHALQPERERRDAVEKRHEKRRAKDQRALFRAIALATPNR